MPLPEINLPLELDRIKRMGWVQSLRKGDTGIGKTIETLLDIKENNQGGADCTYKGIPVEIKAHRSNSKSMITLFTLEAGLRNLNDVEFMRVYGYINGNGRQALKVTLSTTSFIPQGLKLSTDIARGTISIVNRQQQEIWVWTTKGIHLKLHNLCIVYAVSKTENGTEQFKVESAWLLTGLSVKCFFDLVDHGIVKIDLRMHIKPNGTSRNHGTGFRILSWDELRKCYKSYERLL